MPRSITPACQLQVLFIDVHGHSAKRNVFLYGCSGSDGREKLLPRLLSQRCSHVSFRDCR